jgi:inner membrane protein
MPSVFSHAIAGLALGAVAVGGRSRAIVWGLGALCAVAPDLDAVTLFMFRIPYRHMLGHRGLSHSLLLAAVLALLVTVVVRRVVPASPGPTRLWLLFFVATASHGVLDAMTNGGLGVAFFAPFSDARYFFPWRPILVSPISLHVFFGYRGLRVMWSELGWIWLPAAVVFLAGLAWRKRDCGSTSRKPLSGAT